MNAIDLQLASSSTANMIRKLGGSISLAGARHTVCKVLNTTEIDDNGFELVRIEGILGGLYEMSEDGSRLVLSDGAPLNTDPIIRLAPQPKAKGLSLSKPPMLWEVMDLYMNDDAFYDSIRMSGSSRLNIKNAAKHLKADAGMYVLDGTKTWAEVETYLVGVLKANHGGWAEKTPSAYVKLCFILLTQAVREGYIAFAK